METEALKIEGLTKVYGGKTHALKGVNLKIGEGDFFSLIGANGAGKTTLIGIVTGLVLKTSGRAFVYGIDIEKYPMEAKALIGVMPQELNFNIFAKVIDVLINQAGYYGIKRSKAAADAEFFLHKLHLWDKRESEIRRLSGGMKRRLMLARALIHKPKLLLLDEPTTGIDVEMRHATWNFLKELNGNGTTILLTTHYLEEAEHLCNRCAIIKQGTIVRVDATEALIESLERQTYIIKLSRALPPLHLPHWRVQFDDSSPILEVEISPQQTLTAFMRTLADHDIEILDIRPKHNRLEQLFLNVLKTTF